MAAAFCLKDKQGLPMLYFIIRLLLKISFELLNWASASVTFKFSVSLTV
jgi:hypothetical protein